MKGILGRPYYDLDPFLPLNRLSELADEIAFGLAKMQRYAPGVILHPENYFESSEKTSTLKALGDTEKKFGSRFRELDPVGKLILSSFYSETSPLGCAVNLRGPRPDLGPDEGFRKKHLSGFSIDTAWASSFPRLMDYVKTELPFREVGRVVIFVTYPGMSGPIHNDYADGSRGDEFIWINPMGAKRFFVFDETTKTKNYVTSRSAVFDNSDFHGYDASKRASFSVRVDGVFRDEFLVSTGMNDYFGRFRSEATFSREY